MATTLPDSLTAAPEAQDESDDERRRRLRTVVAASLLGTTVEWYDFFLYATAAGADPRQRPLFLSCVSAHGGSPPRFPP